MDHMTFYELSAIDIEGSRIGMDAYKGLVVLVVNTASKCGFTPQFAGLQKLYDDYRDDGFEILGFPCSQFGNQEPGTSGEIASFCRMNYGVTFTMFKKIDVNGSHAHPLFRFLKKEAPALFGRDISWNFTKFLIDRKGNVIKRYLPIVPPEKIRKDIEQALA